MSAGNSWAAEPRIYPLPSTWYAISHLRPTLNYYSQPEARQRLGWANQTIYIIAVGRLVPLKQFPIQQSADPNFINRIIADTAQFSWVNQPVEVG